MMLCVVCFVSLAGVATSAKAKTRAKDFAWPWDGKPAHVNPSMVAKAQRDFTGAVDAVTSDDSSSGSGLDFMDNYIAESSGKQASSSQTDDQSSTDMFSSHTDSISNARENLQSDMSSMFSSNTGGASDSQGSNNLNAGSDSLWSNHFNADVATRDRHTESADQQASVDMSNMFGDSSGSAMSFQKSAGDSSDQQETDPNIADMFRDTKSTSASKRSRSDNADQQDLAHLLSASSDDRSSMANPWDEQPRQASHASDRESSGFPWAMSAASDDSSANNDPAIMNWQSSKDQGAPIRNQANNSPDSSFDAPAQQASSPVDHPVDQTQVQSSVQGASATDQVVDIKLSSELQESLLQAKNAESQMLARFRR